MPKAKRAFVLGLDAMVPNMTEKFLREGILPNIGKLVERGCLSRVRSVIPAQTPSNWHTIATGATPGTHGVTLWGSHSPGEPVWEGHRDEAFNAGLCRAEYIWEAAARAGRQWYPSAQGAGQAASRDQVRTTMRNAISSILLAVVLVALSFLVGCTTSYTIHFADSATQRPVAEALVEIMSVPQIYSFLDPRHYLGPCGKTFKVQGQTDVRGRMDFNMPKDLDIWFVVLKDNWFAKDPPAWWTPMLTPSELEARTSTTQLADVPGRPHVRIEKK